MQIGIEGGVGGFPDCNDCSDLHRSSGDLLRAALELNGILRGRSFRDSVMSNCMEQKKTSVMQTATAVT